MGFPEELVARAREYAQRRGLVLGDELGAGVQGIVFATESQPEHDSLAVRSAVKVHRRGTDYTRERDVYLRLRGFNVTAVRGCHVPQLLRYDDELWVIEMTIVSRPFVLDFAGAYLDRAPEYSDEVMADWRAEKAEEFGPRWADVQAIVAILEHNYGVILHDVSPRYISFDD